MVVTDLDGDQIEAVVFLVGPAFRHVDDAVVDRGSAAIDPEADLDLPDLGAGLCVQLVEPAVEAGRDHELAAAGYGDRPVNARIIRGRVRGQELAPANGARCGIEVVQIVAGGEVDIVAVDRRLGEWLIDQGSLPDRGAGRGVDTKHPAFAGAPARVESRNSPGTRPAP